MKVNLLPTTRLGKWSGGLLLAFVVLVAGQVALDVAISGPDPAWPQGRGAVNFALVVAASVVAAVAVVRRGERSVVAYLAIAFGIIAVLFELVESIAGG